MGKAWFIGMMLFTALMAAAAAAPATGTALDETQAALAQGDASQARGLADAALKESRLGTGDRARLLLYRGLAEELLGEGSQAAADFTTALDSRGLAAEDRAQALLQRGFLRDGLGRLDQAAADYSTVIALKAGGVSTALNNRANIYRRQNRMTEARRDYLAALSGGGSQYSYYGLGQIAEAQHDPLAARGFYAKAVSADPRYALASQRLAALGGPPEGAIPEQAPSAQKPPPILLHPPAPAKAEAIVLRPPSRMAKAAASPVLLRPPFRRNRPAAPAARLRPALDARRGPEVQLGAWRSEAEARAGWAQARGRAGGALDGLIPHIVATDLPGRGRYYRLRTSPPSGQAPASFCARLTASGLGCFPARD